MSINPSISAIFKLFSVAFRPPSSGPWTESITSGSLARDMEGCWRALELDEAPLSAFLNALASYENRDRDAVLHELRIEATRLFIGDGPLVENAEGTWLQAHAGVKKPIRMINNHTVAVTEFMKSCGIIRQPKYNDCIDYLENECDFAGYLASEPATLAEAGINAADKLEEFVTQHMQLWVPGFCDEVAKQSTCSYYQGICVLMKAFVGEF